MKITLKNTWLHFKKICIHKYWVAKYCFKAGLIWQGLMHDMSKFSWIEFWESVRYYQGTSSPINACKADKGYSLAWQHHKGHNPHHYEYWTDKYDYGTVCIEMPYNYAVEMICDYLGAARAYQGNKFTYHGEYEWWKNKREISKMHLNTKTFVSVMFKIFANLEKDGKDVEYYINEDVFKYVYKNYKRLSEASMNELMNEKSMLGDAIIDLYTE